MEKHLSAEEIIEKLGISRKTLDNWIEKGQFPKPFKIGRRIFWKESEIEEYLESTRK
jgi:excisionase family DNA binding protein